jgi:hypothetical protein
MPELEAADQGEGCGQKGEEVGEDGRWVRVDIDFRESRRHFEGGC